MIPFAGWVPTEAGYFTPYGPSTIPSYPNYTPLSAPPSQNEYEDPTLWSGQPGVWTPGPSYNHPADWVDGGYPAGQDPHSLSIEELEELKQKYKRKVFLRKK